MLTPSSRSAQQRDPWFSPLSLSLSLSLPLSVLLVCHPAAKRRDLRLSLPLPSLPQQKPHHLDQSCSQSHREQHSGKTPVFRLCCCRWPSFLFVIPQRSEGICFPTPSAPA